MKQLPKNEKMIWTYIIPYHDANKIGIVQSKNDTYIKVREDENGPILMTYKETESYKKLSEILKYKGYYLTSNAKEGHGNSVNEFLNIPVRIRVIGKKVLLHFGGIDFSEIADKTLIFEKYFHDTKTRHQLMEDMHKKDCSTLGEE